MSSRRVLKAAEAIRQVVSMAILTEIKDPRVSDVTVTRVEVAGDMREAKVYVSVMGDEQKQSLSMHGLRSSAGFLQAKVAQRIDTRYTPRLKFVLDQGVKHSLAIQQILDDVLPPQQGEDRAEGTDSVDLVESDSPAAEASDHDLPSTAESPPDVSPSNPRDAE